MNNRKEINEIKEAMKGLLDRLDKLENTIPLPLDPFYFFKVELPKDCERLYFIDNLQSTILSKIFIHTIKNPANGPIANPPINAGSSAISISINVGAKGSGTLINIKSTDIDARIAIFVISQIPNFLLFIITS